MEGTAPAPAPRSHLPCSRDQSDILLLRAGLELLSKMRHRDDKPRAATPPPTRSFPVTGQAHYKR